MNIGACNPTVVMIGDSNGVVLFSLESASEVAVLEFCWIWCGGNHSRCYFRIAMSSVDPEGDLLGLSGGLSKSCCEMSP